MSDNMIESHAVTVEFGATFAVSATTRLWMEGVLTCAGGDVLGIYH